MYLPEERRGCGAGCLKAQRLGTRAPPMPIPLRWMGQEPSEALTPEEGAGVPGNLGC